MTAKKLYCVDPKCGFSRDAADGGPQECFDCFGPTELREDEPTDTLEAVMDTQPPECQISARVTNAIDDGGKTVSITVLLTNESSTQFEGDVYLADVYGEEGTPRRFRLAPNQQRQFVPHLERGDNASDVIALRLRPKSTSAAFFEVELATERPKQEGGVKLEDKTETGNDNVVINKQTYNIHNQIVKEEQFFSPVDIEYRGIKRQARFSNAAACPPDQHRELTQSRYLLPDDPYLNDQAMRNGRGARLTVLHSDSNDSGCPLRTHLFAGPELILGRSFPKKAKRTPGAPARIEAWYERPLEVTDPDQPYKYKGNKKARNKLRNEYPPVDLTIATEYGSEDFTYISAYACRIDMRGSRTKVSSFAGSQVKPEPAQRPDDTVEAECTLKFGSHLPPIPGHAVADRLSLDLKRQFVPLQQEAYLQFSRDHDLRSPVLATNISSLSISRSDDVRENYVLLNPATLVGTGENCGWQLTGADILPVHACIIWMDDTFWIEPRHANAVVKLADERRLKLHELHRLLPGETLWLGSRMFTVAASYSQHIVHCRHCKPALPPDR